MSRAHLAKWEERRDAVYADVHYRSAKQNYAPGVSRAGVVADSLTMQMSNIPDVISKFVHITHVAQHRMHKY